MLHYDLGFNHLFFSFFFNLFQGLTAYHDIALDKCYITELNTTMVMPPRNLWELLVNVKVRHSLCSLLMSLVKPQ